MKDWDTQTLENYFADRRFSVRPIELARFYGFRVNAYEGDQKDSFYVLHDDGSKEIFISTSLKVKEINVEVEKQVIAYLLKYPEKILLPNDDLK